MSSGKWRPFCPGGDELKRAATVPLHQTAATAIMTSSLPYYRSLGLWVADKTVPDGVNCSHWRGVGALSTWDVSYVEWQNSDAGFLPNNTKPMWTGEIYDGDFSSIVGQP